MQVPYQSAHSAALGEMCVTEIPTRVFTLQPWVRCVVLMPYQSVDTAALGEMWGVFDFLWCDCVFLRCVYFKHIAHD